MEIACLILLATASVTDHLKRLIPNILTLPACLLGFCYHTFVHHGTDGAVFSLGGMLLGFLLLAPAYVAGLMGGGDVKLLITLGAWVGAGAVSNIFLYSTICGGFMVLVQAIQYRVGLHIPLMQNHCQNDKSFNIDTIPYAFAFGGGYLIYLFLGSIL